MCNATLLTHLTFNTGDITRTLQNDVCRPVIDKLLPLLDQDDHAVPTMPNWILTSSSADSGGYAGFVLRRKDRNTPSAVGTVCWNEMASQAAWHHASKGMTAFRSTLEVISLWRDLDPDPPKVPWVAVGHTSMISFALTTELVELHELEQCIAWTIMDAHWR